MEEKFAIAIESRPLPPTVWRERLRHQDAIFICNKGEVAPSARKVDLLGPSGDLHGHMEGTIALLIRKLESCPDILGSRRCRHVPANEAFDIGASDDRLIPRAVRIEKQRYTKVSRDRLNIAHGRSKFAVKQRELHVLAVEDFHGLAIEPQRIISGVADEAQLDHV